MKRAGVETTRGGTFLKTDRGSSEITGRTELRETPNSRAIRLLPKPWPSSSRIRSTTAGFSILLSSRSGKQVDACHIRVIHLRVLQVGQIWVELVHLPSSSGVQEGGQF